MDKFQCTESFKLSSLLQMMNCVRRRFSNLLILFVCSTFLGLYFLTLMDCDYFTMSDQVDNGRLLRLLQDAELRGQRPMFQKNESVQMRTNIFFLKTHKTGSSTLQNILLRFGLRLSLNVMLPEVGNYIAYDAPLNDKSLGKRLTPADGKFNIFACHSRYHPDTLKFMQKDTIRVTLLRSPPEYFESLYNFFYLYRKYNMTFEELLRSLPQASKMFTRTGLRTKGVNQMSYELGLLVDEPSDAIIRDFLRYADAEFDFVMITEYFDVCLVLLADLMGWPLEFVAYLPLMARNDAKRSNVSRADAIKLRQLNRADSFLYDYFLTKLRERALRYGVDRLMKSLRTLRKLNEHLYERCISAETRSGYGGTVAYKLRSDADWECVYAAKGELEFIEEIRRTQIERFQRDREFLELVSISRSGNGFPLV